MHKIAVTVGLIALSLQPALAASTIQVESRGVLIVDAKNIELGEGTTAQPFESKFVETGTGGDWSGENWTGECYGLGEVHGDSYADNILCVSHLSKDDSYAMRMHFNTDGWDWTVLGGTGKYQDATGSGHVTSGWGDPLFGVRLTYTSKGTIALK